MSVDSTALERSALERKDRDELVTIAKALGGKPPARAKKADIVDLVLELTGVGGDGPAAEAAPEAARRRPRPGASRARKAPAGRGAAGRVGGGGGRRRRRRRDSRRGADEPTERPGDGNGQEPAPAQGGGSRRARAAARTTTRAATAAAGAAAATAIARAAVASPGGAPEEYTGEPIEVEGHLDLRDEGYGFLRIRGFLPVARRRLRVGEAGPPVRSAQGRPPQGRQPAGAAQREEPGAAADRRGERQGPRGRPASGPASRTSPRCSPTSASRWSARPTRRT